MALMNFRIFGALGVAAALVAAWIYVMSLQHSLTRARGHRESGSACGLLQSGFRDGGQTSGGARCVTRSGRS